MQHILSHPKSNKKLIIVVIVWELLSIVQREKTDIGSGYNPLDSFFPFDPYLLQESSKYISPLYINWSDVVDGMTESLGSEFR